MQLLMRRPEIRGFISVAPPANMYDFSFLAPCPASGLFLHGTADTVVPPVEVERVVNKLRTQKGIVIDYELEDAVDLVKDAFVSAGERDIRTGDAVEICIITAAGCEVRTFPLNID